MSDHKTEAAAGSGYAGPAGSVFFRDYPGPYTARCSMPGISMDDNIYASNGACVACGVVNGEGLEAVLNAAWCTHTQNSRADLTGDKRTP